MKRRRQGRIAWGALVVSVFMVAGLGGAETVAASESPCPPPDGRALCVSVTHTPVDVSAASPGAPTFVAYAVTVRNGGGSTLTHTTVNACLTAGAESAGACAAVPPGAAFFSATPSRGACSIAGSTARCELGSLARGAVATIELVARAPTQPGSFQDLVTVSAKERGSDSPGQDPNAGHGHRLRGGDDARPRRPKGELLRPERDRHGAPGSGWGPERAVEDSLRSTTPSARRLPSRTSRRSPARQVRSAGAAAG